MNRILIATDGSAAAHDAVELGLDLALEQGASVSIVHVVPGIDVVPWSGLGMTAAVPHTVDDRDRAPIDEALELARARGMDVHTELLTGNPVDEIVAYADSYAFDLIVLGSRGHGALASAVLGSVSLGVLHETRRPVLIVRRAAVASEAEAVAV